MYTAQKKKKENIGEYILYMWQIEDLLRACNFNHDEIEKNIIEKYDVSEDKKSALRKWYYGLNEQMVAENICEKGHLKSLKTIVADLNKRHSELLTIENNAKYQHFYALASANIEYLKQNNKAETNDIETIFEAIYLYFMLRLQNKEVSEETTNAITSLTKMLTFLSAKYKSAND